MPSQSLACSFCRIRIHTLGQHLGELAQLIGGEAYVHADAHV